VECGFLTNPDEAALLQNETYQELVAEAIEQGVLNYLENETTM
jgi:N-acetylmuramoyl-L-alanine amidase